MSDAQYEKMMQSAKRSAYVFEKAFEANVYPAIGDKRANTVTVEDCTDIHRTIAGRGTPVQANRVISYLAAAFQYSIAVKGKTSKVPSLIAWYKATPKFGVTLNPAHSVERLKEDKDRLAKERTLSFSELRTVWLKADMKAAPALKLLLSTGQRVEEVLEATWSEFDLDKNEWVIPHGRRKADYKSENNQPHVVPLEKIHLDLLKQAKAASGRSKYVFPSKSGQPQTSKALNKAVGSMCKSIGVAKFTPRDCRRTFKTTASEAGAGDGILDRLQGHNLSDLSSKHYNRNDKLPEKRACMRLALRFLTAIIENPPTDDAETIKELAGIVDPTGDNVVQITATN
jgi:integrase